MCMDIMMDAHTCDMTCVMNCYGFMMDVHRFVILSLWCTCRDEAVLYPQSKYVPERKDLDLPGKSPLGKLCFMLNEMPERILF